MGTSLTTGEKRKLKTLEETIEKGLQSFVDVGNALAAIRDEKLYSDVSGTFDEYCKKRWGFARHRAYQLIEAATVVDNCQHLGSDIPPPANEAQVRPLTELETEQERATAWTKAVETAPKDSEGKPKVTASHVAKIVAEMQGETDDEPKAEEQDEPEVEEEPTLEEACEAENKAIESFCRDLVKFYEANAPRTVWTEADGRIDSALSNVRAGCATLRTAKAVLCPACEEGQQNGRKCGYCAGHGYLPKIKADQVAGAVK